MRGVDLRRLALRRVTRRGFLAIAAAAGSVPAAARWAGAAPTTGPSHEGAPPAAGPREPLQGAPAQSAPAYLFFDAVEASCIEALCERLIPEEASGPGALAADVPRHLDAQLAGDWGGGERAYRPGVWQPGTPFHDYRGAATPRDLFRRALAAIDAHFGRRGTTYGRSTHDTQHAYLRLLEAGQVTWSDAHAGVFFDLLVKMTVEAYFADPLRCARRETLPWRMVGFPGACAHAGELA